MIGKISGLVCARWAVVKIHVGWFCLRVRGYGQCVIDVTGFRSKGTSRSEARIKLSPWMLNMSTCTDHQLFIFVRNYGSFWVCWKLEICRSSLLSRSNLDWVGERGDLQGSNIASTPTFLDWTFHYYSFGNSRCTPCAHNDGLWYVRGVSKMCRCAGRQLILDDL